MWSNLVSWLIPTLGIFTAAATVAFTSVAVRQKQKKYYFLAGFALILSIVFPLIGILNLKMPNIARYFSKQESKVATSEKQTENTNNFNKKLACTRYFDKIKNDLTEKRDEYFQTENSSAITRLFGYEDFLFGFYSPKLNSCLYAVKEVDPGSTLDERRSNVYLGIENSFKIYDALTSETIKTFPES